MASLQLDRRDRAPLSTVPDATHIPVLRHDEAADMAAAELGRFLALLESLDADDWSKPTACTRWDVRQIVAHVAGAAAGYARWSEFGRQMSPLSHRPYRRAGLSFPDAFNQLQVDDRAQAAPAELIAELRTVGPRAIATRHRLPALVRALRLPIPMIGVARIDYLTDLIYTRDMWMHRLDICRATGREMVLSTEHDGRIVALVMRDLARDLARKRDDFAVVYELAGPAGGAWRIGRAARVDATIRMDALAFNLLASGRLAADRARALSTTVVVGDEAAAAWALEQTSVVY